MQCYKSFRKSVPLHLNCFVILSSELELRTLPNNGANGNDPLARKKSDEATAGHSIHFQNFHDKHPVVIGNPLRELAGACGHAQLTLHGPGP